MVALQHHSKTHNVPISKLAVLGFDNSNHGSSQTCLSCSSDQANSYNLATFDWPKAEFPQLKYPLAEFEVENT